MANTRVQDVNRQWEIINLLICAEEKYKIDRSNTEVETMTYFLTSDPIKRILLDWLHDMAFVNGCKTDLDIATKSDDVSLRWRLKGNDNYKNGLIKESYECFTKSVSFAVKLGPKYSLALANRSAALFKLQRYKDCLEDIALALDFRFPCILKHKLYLRRSECYIELNQVQNAKIALAAAKEVVNVLRLTEAEEDIFEGQVQEVTRKIDNLSVNESRPDVIVLPLCYLGENENFVSASNAVELSNSVYAGRCVVSKKPINRGDVLFAEEPYACVTLCTENPICEMCCSVDINPVPCNDCSRSVYCNDKCRSLAAVSFHKWECQGKQSGIFKVIGVGQLALRVLLMSAERGFPEIPEPVAQEFITAAGLFHSYNDSNYDNIQLYNKSIPAFYRMFNLTSNMDKLNNDDYLLYAMTATMLHMYLQNYTNFYDYLPTRIPYQMNPFQLHVFSAAFIFRSIAQLVCNGHSVTSLMTCREHEKQSDVPVDRRTANEQELFRATAIYPSAAMMNHSCDPNIVSNYYKNRLMVRALREMPAGTEILNCYGPNSARHTTTQRKYTLKTQYKFNCNCAPCNDRRDFASLFNAYACQSCKGPVLWMGSTYRCQQCHAEFNRSAALETIEIAEEIMKRAERARLPGKRLELAHQAFSLKRRVLHRHHKQLRIMADILAKMYIDAGEYTKSAELMRQNIQSHEYQFGSFSVEVAYDLKKLSYILIEKIHNSSPANTEFSESVLEAYRVITKAIQLIELNYGSWEPLVKILQVQESFVATFLNDRRTAHASQRHGAHRHVI